MPLVPGSLTPKIATQFASLFIGAWPESKATPGRMPTEAYIDFADPIQLTSPVAGPVLADVALRVVVRQIEVGREPYECRIVGYRYALMTPYDREIISFHWTPEMAGNQRPYPHMHIGSLISGERQIVPDRSNKLHIPTGVISLGALVRFLVQELDVRVRPGRNRDSMLRARSNS